MLMDWVQSQGVATVGFRDPGATVIGEKIREILLSPAHEAMTTPAEVLLYMAARVQLWAEKIKPALSEGKCVVLDRWLSSTCAYQGYAGGFGVEKVIEIAQDSLGEGLAGPDHHPGRGSQDRRPAAQTRAGPDGAQRRQLSSRVREGFLKLAQGPAGFRRRGRHRRHGGRAQRSREGRTKAVLCRLETFSARIEPSGFCSGDSLWTGRPMRTFSPGWKGWGSTRPPASGPSSCCARILRRSKAPPGRSPIVAARANPARCWRRVRIPTMPMSTRSFWSTREDGKGKKTPDRPADRRDPRVPDRAGGDPAALSASEESSSSARRRS